MKAELDNCKLRYDWLDEGLLIEAVVRHLQEGRLVAWFEGRMEWGPRALGARSILASPFSPFVLENLNHFLKRRESWRGYALSTLADEAPSHFSGPAEAPFMECDYRPLDAARFRHVMPSEAAHVRVRRVSGTHRRASGRCSRRSAGRRAFPAPSTLRSTVFTNRLSALHGTPSGSSTVQEWTFCSLIDSF